LARIISHPHFKSAEVPQNVRTMRKWRERLPLHTIKAHTIPIKTKHTPSTSTPVKQAYTFSLYELIEQVLCDPILFKKMYFGPGKSSSCNHEFWHGNIWKQSPLFGEEYICIQNGLYFLKMVFLQYK